MAIPAFPQQFFVQQGNRQVFVSWALSAGATSYSVQRSTDGINYTVVATPTVPQYLDTTVVVGTQYYYQVASVNGSGISVYTPAQSIVPSPSAELSLGELRLRAQQRADRVNSQFVTLPEWNFFINQSLYELYDLLITVYEDYFEAPEITFAANGSDYFYPLPDGVLTFRDSATGNVIVAPPFYKLSGVDLGLNTANNAYVTINKYNLIDRNRFVYPNTASTIYGVFNLQYRMMGNNIRFIPTPSAGQNLRLLYIPRLPTLLQDTDLSTLGYSGWLQYVIIRAAKYALDKEESDTTSLDQELLFLKDRIETSSMNRDAGQPDKVSDTRQGNWADGWWGGNNGAIGGWAMLPLSLGFPILSQHNIGNILLTDTVRSSYGSLGYAAALICCAYFLYLNRSQFSSRISFSRIRNFISKSASTFFSHVRHIIKLSPKKKMVDVDTHGVVAAVTNIKASRNKLSCSQLESNSSGSPILSFKKEPGSSISTTTTKPQPAAIFYTLIDLTPKSNLGFHTHTLLDKDEDCQ